MFCPSSPQKAKQQSSDSTRSALASVVNYTGLG